MALKGLKPMTIEEHTPKLEVVVIIGVIVTLGYIYGGDLGVRSSLLYWLLLFGWLLLPNEFSNSLFLPLSEILKL